MFIGNFSIFVCCDSGKIHKNLNKYDCQHLREIMSGDTLGILQRNNCTLKCISKPSQMAKRRNLKA